MKTHEELGITETQHRALVLTLEFMESGKLPYVRMDDLEQFDNRGTIHDPLHLHSFNMTVWQGEHACGTVGCIGGTAEMLIKERVFNGPRLHRDLNTLFFPHLSEIGGYDSYDQISIEEATNQLRKYLETGTHDWT